MKNKTLLLSLLIAGVAIFGVSKAVKDTLEHHYSQSVFASLPAAFWNPAVSWKNKYQDWDAGDKHPAFAGADNILVSLTDAWHLFDLLGIVALIVAGLAAGRLVSLSARPGRAWWIWGAFILLGGIGVFHAFYTWIFV
jgi:hypothetical protein